MPGRDGAEDGQLLQAGQGGMMAVPIPEIYVLWHPKCPVGAKLAKRIHEWLRPGRGLGPDVYFRSLPAPEAPPGGLPPPLPGEKRDGAKAGKRISNLQIVLPLIDQHLVTDAAWRCWLDELGKPSSVARQIIPTALDATAYNMPASLRKLNYLRPSGLPPTWAVDDAALEPMILSLLKQVTEALCRILLLRAPAAQDAQAAWDAPAPKVNIFLSHAKIDGAAPARRIRDYIYSQTQLSAFYDENDIPFGGVFSRVLKNDLKSPNTAALIAIHSSHYASRPWCRRELSVFRRPRWAWRDDNGADHFRLNATLVVEAMDGRDISSGIAEFGNSPAIRWNEQDTAMESLVVTTLVRDAMLASFHEALGASLPTDADHVVINWAPDPTTLLHINRVRRGRQSHVLYPGRGLSYLELNALGEWFPHLTFRSFEEALL
jgi:hypothetical protein